MRTIVVLAGGAHGATPAPFSASQPSWSPDGTRVAFSGSVAGSGRSDVYTIARTGSGLTNLTATDAETEHVFPAWSPGGMFVASGAEAGDATQSREAGRSPSCYKVRLRLSL